MRRIFLAASAVLILSVFTLVSSWVTMFGLGTHTHVTWPTWQWWGYLVSAMPDPQSQLLVNQWLLVGGGAGLVATGLLAYRIVSDGNVRLGRDPVALYGDARFATVRDGRKSGLRYSLRPDPKCLILGRTKGLFGLLSRYVMLAGVEHVMLYAKTGFGKGVSYVLTNCFNYEDSLVVLDLKRDNENLSAAHREENLGQKVFSFSPMAKDGCTHRWNPVGGIDESQEDYVSRLQSKSYSFFPNVAGREKFWQDGARSAWLGIAVLICETKADPRYADDPNWQLNPGNIFRFFSRSDTPKVLARMIEERRNSDRPYSQTCIELLSDYLTGTDEVVSGVRRHVTTNMGLWFNPQVVAATSTSDFDLRQLRREKMTIYIGVMPPDLPKLGTLLQMFFLQTFEDNTDVTPEQDPTIRHRAHILLDEATNIPAMQPIAEAIAFARGFWLHFSFVVQSKHQIEEKYKEMGASSLLENMGAEIVYATDNIKLMQEVSARAGDKTVESVSRSVPRFLTFWRVKEQSETTGMIKRPLILPQDVNNLPMDEEYMFRATAPVFHLKRTIWYKDRNFRNLASNWVRPPRITFTMRRDDGSVKFDFDDDAPSGHNDSEAA